VARDLSPFFASEDAADRVIGDLAARGWIVAVGDDVSLTAAGADLVAEAGREISRTRSRITEGLTRDDYELTLQVLETMCRNLGWDGS
jgi:DNA-binding MarR family transcriptional regulator